MVFEMTRLETALRTCETMRPDLSQEQQIGLSIAIGVLKQLIDFERKERIECGAEECTHNHDCKCMRQGLPAFNMDHQCQDYQDKYCVDPDDMADEAYHRRVDDELTERALKQMEVA
jgi:hypothetical protein